jgi:hypothetical protein
MPRVSFYHCFLSTSALLPAFSLPIANCLCNLCLHAAAIKVVVGVANAQVLRDA